MRVANQKGKIILFYLQSIFSFSFWAMKLEQIVWSYFLGFSIIFLRKLTKNSYCFNFGHNFLFFLISFLQVVCSFKKIHFLKFKIKLVLKWRRHLIIYFFKICHKIGHNFILFHLVVLLFYSELGYTNDSRHTLFAGFSGLPLFESKNLPWVTLNFPEFLWVFSSQKNLKNQPEG